VSKLLAWALFATGTIAAIVVMVLLNPECPPTACTHFDSFIQAAINIIVAAIVLAVFFIPALLLISFKARIDAQKKLRAVIPDDFAKSEAKLRGILRKLPLTK
jgi:hypothetical protein